MEYKVCTTCFISKGLDEFDKQKHGKGGRFASCRVCQKMLAQERNKKKRAGEFVPRNDISRRKEEFLGKAFAAYADLYNYEGMVFSGMTVPVQIYCNKHHNTFWQKPNLHLKGLGGCRECALEAQREKTLKTQEEYLRDCCATWEHSPDYSYERVVYKGAFEPVEIFCKKHKGYFWQRAEAHTQGRGCLECSMKEGHEKLRHDQDEFLKRAHEVCGSTYTFDRAVYTYSYVPLTVTCRVHGDFPISPSNLYLGKGCPKCAQYGYNKALYGNLYLLQCGNIIKVGITNRDVSLRLKEICRESGKSFTIIFEQGFLDGSIAWDVEQILKKHLNKDHQPVVEKFGGSTECFTGANPRVILELAQQHILDIQGVTQ